MYVQNTFTFVFVIDNLFMNTITLKFAAFFTKKNKKQKKKNLTRDFT